MSEARAGLAATLAEILTSTEALALSPQAASSAHSAPGAVDPASEPEARAAARAKSRGARAGHAYLHSAIDGHTRLAYTESLEN